MNNSGAEKHTANGYFAIEAVVKDSGLFRVEWFTPIIEKEVSAWLAKYGNWGLNERDMEHFNGRAPIQKVELCRVLDRLSHVGSEYHDCNQLVIEAFRTGCTSELKEIYEDFMVKYRGDVNEENFLRDLEGVVRSQTVTRLKKAMLSKRGQRLRKS